MNALRVLLIRTNLVWDLRRVIIALRTLCRTLPALATLRVDVTLDTLEKMELNVLCVAVGHTKTHQGLKHVGTVLETLHLLLEAPQFRHVHVTPISTAW